MRWQDLTVKQYQELKRTLENKAGLLPELVDMEVCRICYGLTQEEADALSLDKYKEKLAKLEFIHTVELPAIPRKHITVGKTRYRFLYDIRRVAFAAHRYIEAKVFESRDPVDNLHRLAASIVMPQKRNWLGIWRDCKYVTADHAKYAEDIQSMPITAVYGSVVFFWKVYTTTIVNLRTYMEQEILKMKEKPNADQQQALIHLWQIMDGFSKQPLSLNMSV